MKLEYFTCYNSHGSSLSQLSNIICASTAKAIAQASFNNQLGNVLCVAADYDPRIDLANVVLWVRPDKGLSTSGGLVTAWNDQSGVGDSNRNFAPVTDKPAFNSSDSTANNQPTIGTFNIVGSANNCKLVNPGAWNTTYTTFSLIIIGYAPAGTGIRYFSSSTSSDRLAIARSASNVNVEYVTGAGSEVGNTGVSANSLRLMIAEIDGVTPANGKMYADSVSSGTSMTAAGSLGATAFCLGSYTALNLATTFGVERIAEAMVISGKWSALSAGQKSRYAGYINARYNKSIS